MFLSNSSKAFQGKTNLSRSFFFFLCCFFLCHGVSVGQRPKAEVYKILGISVEGNFTESGTESGAIIERSGLKVGNEISVPGDQIRKAILQLWALRIFSDVQIVIERQTEDGVYLLIKVKEYPRLLRYEINGADDVSDDDIKKKITLVNGQIVTPDDIKHIVDRVQQLYAEEGHLLAKIETETIAEDTTKANKVVLKLNIDEGPSISIDKIYFTGNAAFGEGDLKDAMDDTKEKVWWHFWSKPKFDRKKFDDDKQKVLKFYRNTGYLDAEIISDSTWYSADKRKISVLTTVREGPRYTIRSITWDGVSVYKPEVLNSRLLVHTGDIFDQEKFDKSLHGGPDDPDVSSLYYDNGYLMSYIDPEIKRIACDTSQQLFVAKGDSGSVRSSGGEGCVDIVIHVYERNQFRIGKVDIKGNTKTKDNVIRRELYTRPSDYFSREKIIRSLRQLSQLNYFNPERLKPDTRIADDKTVDLAYEVEEKSSDNVNASIGYSQIWGATGMIGFTLNNFSLEEPLQGGGGQILNVQWEFGQGSRYRQFSLGFTEPWLYNTPTTLGLSFYDTRQIFIYDLQQTGVSLRLGRRLKWPDDYFRADWTVRFQNNNVIDNGGVPFYRIGKTTQYSVTQSISRNSSDSPIFPSIGSIMSLSVEMAGGPLLPGNVDYHKWLFNADWFTPLLGSNRLVLYAGTTFGYVDGFKDDSEIPPIEYFFMGGTGFGYIATTPLRGYEERSVGPKDPNGNEVGGRVLIKHTAELRLAVTLNPIPIYLLGFVEGGNVFENFGRANFLDLKRSYGFGARLLINPIGMIGFDYGYGVDPATGPYGRPEGTPSGWKFHFQFGRGF